MIQGAFRTEPSTFPCFSQRRQYRFPWVTDDFNRALTFRSRGIPNIPQVIEEPRHDKCHPLLADHSHY